MRCDEQLEAAATDVARATLEAKAAEIRRQAAEPAAAPEPERKSEERKAAARKKYREWLAGILRAGWRVVVEAVIDKVRPPG